MLVNDYNKYIFKIKRLNIKKIWKIDRYKNKFIKEIIRLLGEIRKYIREIDKVR